MILVLHGARHMITMIRIPPGLLTCKTTARQSIGKPFYGTTTEWKKEDKDQREIQNHNRPFHVLIKIKPGVTNL